MEPFVLCELRRTMGLSIADMATVLGLEGSNSGDRIREMERGARPISGPILRVLAYIAQAVEIDNERSQGRMTRLMPRWLDCADLENDARGTDFVMHTRWPRFLGWFADHLTEDLSNALRVAGVPIIPLDPRLGLGHLVALFIDQPAGDVVALLEEAARLKEAKTRRDLER